jgi:TonB family protein
VKLRYRNRFFISSFWRMAHNPIFGSDPAKPASSPGEIPIENGAVPATGESAGSDLAELAARFAAHGGGRVSPELSTDLALEIVLNEIVEQACLATRASGAALVLERDGEWVCRASAGSSAPQLGERLNAESGLSRACVKTHTVQRCDDAQNDPRAEAETCRILGLRSVIIFPLLKNGKLAGILEVFSSWPSAFGERDERTLEALSQRVLRNLERASGSIPVGSEPTRGTAPLAESLLAASTGTHAAGSFTNSEVTANGSQVSLGQPAPGRKMDLMTLALSAAVLAYAVLLTVLVAQRLSGRRATRRVGPATTVSAHLMGAASQSAGPAAISSSGTQPAGGKSNPLSATASAGATAGASRAGNASPPPGSLLVYENGKEVFRMNPAAEHRETTGADETEMQRAAAIEPAGILQVPAEEAEASLLHRVEPDYPEAARQQQVEGLVVLDLDVGPDGGVREVKPVSGPPLLAQAATNAVKQWRFKPRLVGGHPAEMQTRITLNFQLPR